MDGIVTNRGTIRQVGNYYSSTMTGNGRIENEGLMDMTVAYGGRNEAEALVQLPVTVATNGVWRVNGNGYVRLGSGGKLNVLGAVEIEPGARLRVENAGAARDVTVQAGAQLRGSGVLQLDGANRLVVSEGAETTWQLNLNDSSMASGEGVLRLLGSRAMYGTYAVRLVLASNSVADVYNTRLSSNTVIEAGALVALNPNYLYTLTVEGTVTNRGTLRQVANYDTSTISGSGRIENEGLMDLTVGYGGYQDAQASMNVVVHVLPSGRLRLNTNGFMHIGSGGSLTVGGTLELQPGSRLRLDNDGTVRDLVVESRNQIAGSGTLQIYGNNRLLLHDDLDMAAHLELYDGSTVAGSGRLRVTGEQTFFGNYSVPMVIASNAVINVLNVRWSSNVLIEAGALVAMNPGYYYTLTIDGTVTNRGTLRQVANYYTSTLAGSGRIENEGLMDLTVGYGGYQDAQASMNVAVHVLPNGRLRLNTNGFMRIGSGGGLTVGGALELQPGSRLRLENDGTARDLVVESRNQITGAGTLQFYGNNRLLLQDDIDMAGHLELYDGSTVAGSGRLRVTGEQTFFGNYSVPMVIASNAVINVLNARWGSNVLIEAGALVAMNPSYYYTLTMDGTVTNRGTLRQVANYYASIISGSGRIVNEGLMDLTVGYGGYQDAQASLNVPVNIASGGRFRLNSGGYVRLANDGVLSVAGELEVQSGARLRYEYNGVPRDLVLLAGGSITGSGVTLIEGANRLTVEGDASLAGGTVQLLGSTTAAGTGLFTVQTNATLYVDHSLTMPGSVDLYGTLTVANASTTFQITGALTLEATSVLNNPGTVRVGGFVNLGGTVNGNAPVLLGGLAAVTIRINRLQLGAGDGLPGRLQAGNSSSLAVTTVLSWTSPAGRAFTVESSTDLRHWSYVPANIAEISPGEYQARPTDISASASFYRIKVNGSK
jgi:uncharacterized protein (AIM24 family)